ncbi:MAG: CxxxxCH/CxxCH domain-containing protein [Candidatus Deferrimicrobium sp.]|nr:CxxxxCH/CxxCH domain-containing protein [Candidatus Deferrimicrobium sp.]
MTGTSPVSGAPLCTSCHIADPRDVTNCTSCHANPPSGATTAYPNVGGTHSVHIALNGAGTPVTCSTCHTGLGSGTLSHYNRTRPTRVSPASVAFVTTYNAKTGASGFDNSSLLRCTDVSCHGGQPTPSWQTGVIDVPNACLSCHASGTAQYNSFNSGWHSLHIGAFGLSVTTCKRCHNTTTLAVNHFTALGTTAMEGPASGTIGGTGTFITDGNYVAGTKSCSPSCHGTETW